MKCRRGSRQRAGGEPVNLHQLLNVSRAAFHLQAASEDEGGQQRFLLIMSQKAN